MVKPNYNCSQQELYAIGRTGWNACSANLTAFSDFKTNYTGPFVEARLQEITSAERLPDEDRREEQSRTSRIRLKDKATEGMAKWQTLKRYITRAFPESQQEVKLDAAGQGQYRKAAKDEWTATQQLLVDGNLFIEANKDILYNNGNMPETFPGAFLVTKTEYDALYQQFLDASTINPANTEAKISANNKVHAQLMEMLLDGQQLFRNSEAMKKMFTFDQVALTVGGPGVQGLKGDVTEPGNLPVANAELTFTGPTVKTVTTDEDGRYECPQLKEGIYTATITAPGFDPLTLKEVEVADGVMKVLDFILVKSV